MINDIDYNFSRHSWFIAGQTAGMHVFRTEGLTAVDSGLSSDTFNVIHIADGTRFSATHLSEVIAYFRSRGMAHCLWVCQANLTKKVAKSLDNLGLREQGLSIGMTLHLGGYTPTASPLHAHIVWGNDSTIIRDFAEVIAHNWSPTDQNVLDFYQKVAPTVAQNGDTTLFGVFYRENQPVAAVELFKSNAQTVGIYGFATRAAYRGLGIGTALITAALNEIKSWGYAQVVLQASDDSAGIFQKLGFVAHTTFFEFA